MKKAGKGFKTGVVILVTGLALLLLFLWLGMTFGTPSKEECIRNMVVFEGKDHFEEDDVPGEIDAALRPFANWNHLFLSENFKSKFRNRGSIIENPWNIEKVWCFRDSKNRDVIVINAEHRKSIFQDETEAITTEYQYRYLLDQNGEIDDLILISKQDIYTFNGELVSNQSFVDRRNGIK